VLESINGVALDAASPGKTIPELAFGEHRSVSGTTGCKRFSGLVVLPLESGDVFC
jgi:heat shock protein HslJ